MPATRALKAALDAAPRRATTILVAPRGTAWRKRHFHELWSEAFAAAKIADDLHFHDLRGTAVTMLAEAGCTVPEIATITGHSQAHAQKIFGPLSRSNSEAGRVGDREARRTPPEQERAKRSAKRRRGERLSRP
ncbi:tyrosine-type recombinase/integrase [Methylobacterium sp. J-043]|nr:tyrosine-type recombinase/integrase [Methylobacterium sp. J-043]